MDCCVFRYQVLAARSKAEVDYADNPLQKADAHGNVVNGGVSFAIVTGAAGWR